ncbi:uncharacterized protein LOC112455532 [Temnothorax curvispinosus]|uniref:Uncharacterized protein LOC112455532 n=1 Tax=Temnothorax curvispinosus TaxID=300111 RepID=A0A6J1PTU6_9HYME|nr:uncharacterized protein LOC112455532 [Temnothorax curvispinosus]
MDSIMDHINQQLVLSNYIANTYDNFIKKGSSGITKQRIDSYLSSLDENWKRFSLNHDAILLAVAKLTSEDRQLILTHSYFTDQLFSVTHMDYVAAVEKIKSSISTDQQNLAGSLSAPSRSQDTHISNVSQYQDARLLQINIPTFDGTPSKWLNFRDLPFYDNPRLQVNTALQSLVNLKSMKKESASELEYLYTAVLQIYRTLETLQRPVDKWDDFLVFMTVQKLDSESVKAWENKLGSSKIPPSWQELNEFLITRLFSLQAHEKSQVGNTAKTHYQGTSGDNASSNTSVCPICKEKHFIVKCPKYINETIAQKLALIAKHKLCYNCLGKHRVANCKVTKRCRTCSKKHHTTIHRTETSFSTKDTKSEPQQQSSLTESGQIYIKSEPQEQFSLTESGQS